MGDYMNLIKPDRSQAKSQTGTYARVLWNQYTDPIGGGKFIHEMKTNYKEKNDTKCINYTCHMSHRATQSMKIMQTDCWVTHTPSKVDRNLQWMLHHPTDPTYISVLS